MIKAYTVKEIHISQNKMKALFINYFFFLLPYLTRATPTQPTNFGNHLETGCQQEGQFALTFDEGPSYYTGILLNILSSQRIKAAFHVTTDYLDNPVILAYLRRAAKDGHLIGMHIKTGTTATGSTGSGNSTSTQSEADIIAGIEALAKKLQPQIGYKPTFLRFPYPGPSLELYNRLRSAGYTVTAYNLDSADYSFSQQSRETAVANTFGVMKTTLDAVLAPAKGAFISVQRDILEYSVNATAQVIDYAKGKGYSFVRLDSCIGKRSSVGLGGGGTDKGKGSHSFPADSNGSAQRVAGESSGTVLSRFISQQAVMVFVALLALWMFSIA